MLMNNIKKYEISKFGLGTVQFGLDYGFTKRKTQDEVNSILKTAVDNNITLIDTAREYGDSEEKIGNFIEDYKHKIEKQQKLRKKTIKAVREHFNIEDIFSILDICRKFIFILLYVEAQKMFLANFRKPHLSLLE